MPRKKPKKPNRGRRVGPPSASTTSPNYSLPSNLIPPAPPAGYSVPGGSSATPGAPAGTVSTTPEAPTLMEKQAKAQRVKAKKKFGEKARAAFKKEYGSEWKEKVYGKQAGKVGETYKAVRGPDATGAQKSAASALTSRFQKAAAKVGVNPPVNAKGSLSPSVKAPPPPGAPVTDTGAAVPPPKKPRKKKKPTGY